MGKYPAYESYRDSGVEWLGDIPKHWQIGSFKRASERVVVGIAEAATYAYADRGVPILRATNIRENKIIGDILYVEPEYSEGRESKLIKANDLVTVRTGNAGVTALIPNELDNCQCFTMLISTLIHSSDSKFYCYFLNSQSSQCYFSLEGWGTAQINISVPILKELPVTLPPLEEQKAIARFLDYKTKQIDALIAKKEVLLEKLDEKRTALISHAVTKGLDATVPMKDSGIEWLGDIPEHWEVKRLKFVADQIIDAEHKTAPYDSDGDYLVVRTANVRSGKLLFENAKYTDESVYKKWTVRAIPEEGDILFTREAPPGEACLVPKFPPICLGQRMVLFKFNQQKNNYFVLHSLYSGIANEFIQGLSMGSTVAHFNMSDIGSIPLFIPPYLEQKEIVEYLERKTAEIDAQKTKIKRASALLNEYRTALITNAVTGKIDVRQVSIPQPQSQ